MNHSRPRKHVVSFEIIIWRQITWPCGSHPAPGRLQPPPATPCHPLPPPSPIPTRIQSTWIASTHPGIGIKVNRSGAVPFECDLESGHGQGRPRPNCQLANVTHTRAGARIHTDTPTHTGVMPRGAIIPPSGLRGGRGWGEGEMRSVGETSSHISLLLQRRRREKVSLVFNSALNPLGFLPPSLPPTTPSLLWGGYVTVCNLPLSVCVCVCVSYLRQQ